MNKTDQTADAISQEQSRFVVLRHLTPATSERDSHWDLMLQRQLVLLTWELVEPLQIRNSDHSTEVRRLADHRIDYLDYEGPVSDDRGRVQREANGIVEWLSFTPTKIEARLESSRLNGFLTLIPENGDQWILWFSESCSNDAVITRSADS